jgi:predicted ATP-grasp superfamily ATP-dependent carboligase
LHRLSLPLDRVRVVSSPHSGDNGTDVLLDHTRIQAANIHEYIDIVYSCAAFVGTESGGSALASAIRQDQKTPNVYALTTTLNWNERMYIFPNVSYTVVSGLQRDW